VRGKLRILYRKEGGGVFVNKKRPKYRNKGGVQQLRRWGKKNEDFSGGRKHRLELLVKKEESSLQGKDSLGKGTFALPGRGDYILKGGKNDSPSGENPKPSWRRNPVLLEKRGAFLGEKGRGDDGWTPGKCPGGGPN